MAEHTPGPWVIKGVSMEDGSYSIGPKDIRIVIAYVTNAASLGDFVSGALKHRRFGHPDDAHTQLANVRLIAAAPELLEALIECKEQLSLLAKDPKGNPWVQQARAAISKATAASPDRSARPQSQERP